MSEELILLEKLHPNPYQGREQEDTEAVRELAENILYNATDDFDGLLQIPTVRPALQGKYDLAFGHTRKAAFEFLFQLGNEHYKSMRVNVRELTDLQMFELGVGENMKRRDLNPMEEARAIHTYMTQFNKTSVEAGAFFNKSPEAVRGAIRLVNLPEKAQEKLRSGEINVTTARAILVVEKLEDASSVEAILDEIDEGNETPMEIIKDAMRFSSNTRDLNGKEWASAAVFPMKHLRPLTLKDIEAVVFSEDANEKTAKLEVAIAEQVFRYVQAGMEVTYDAFPLVDMNVIERVRVLANPPACEKCPFHAALDRDHYCGLVTCAVRKEEAWQKQEAEDISVKTGIPFYDKKDGPKSDLGVYDDGDEKLVKDRHADLRLVPAKNVYNNFDDIGPALKVVAVGELNSKMQKKMAKKAKSEPARKTPERDWELERAVNDLARSFVEGFVWEVAAPVFSVAFDGLTNMAVLSVLSKEFNKALPQGVKLKKDAKKAEALKQARRYLTYGVALEITDLSWGEMPSLNSISKKFTKIAGEWGIKLPKDWGVQVEKFQAEYDAAKKDVIEKRKAEKK